MNWEPIKEYKPITGQRVVILYPSGAMVAGYWGQTWKELDKINELAEFLILPG